MDAKQMISDYVRDKAHEKMLNEQLNKSITTTYGSELMVKYTTV